MPKSWTKVIASDIKLDGLNSCKASEVKFENEYSICFTSGFPFKQSINKLHRFITSLRTVISAEKGKDFKLIILFYKDKLHQKFYI